MEKTVETPEQSRHSTVDFILRRMSRSKGFPAISENISLINRKLTSKDKNISASEISSLVLKDYALTTRLLKQVNTSFYAKARKPVTTVSRAVVLLGLEQVRILATSLMLFEHLSGYAGTDDLKKAAMNSLMSSVLAKGFAQKLQTDPEEAAICAMLHQLGKNLVMLHLQEEHEEIKREMARQGLDEQSASKAVLGKSYHELGMEIAKEWNFSDNIVKSMTPLAGKEIDKPTSDIDILQGISNFSNEICETIRTTPKKGRKKAFELLTRRFEKLVHLSGKDLQEMLDQAKPEMKKLAVMLRIPGSLSVEKVFSETEQSKEKGLKEETSTPAFEKEMAPETSLSPEPPDSSKDGADAGALENIIIDGIQEITNILAEDYTINDLIAMAVEVLYRGFAFSRVLFCLRTAKQPRMMARFGLGKDIKRLLGSFSFRIAKPADLFNVAIAQNRDFRIRDISDPVVKPLIPDWYRRNVNAPSFIIYPISINNVCLGFLYADREDKGDPIHSKHLNYMKTIRNQLVIGIKQKQLGR